MSEIKSCITCEHCIYDECNDRYVSYYYCDKFTTETTNYVTGDVTEWRGNCSSLRRPDGTCGPDGVGWEERKPRPESPKKKNKIKQFFKDLHEILFSSHPLIASLQTVTRA